MPRRIEHHHLLVRMETMRCPKEDEVEAVKKMIQTFMRDIEMKPIDDVRVYYLREPVENKGVTAIVPIETSHIAFHFWDTPQNGTLTNSRAKCLLQFDLYTCGALNHSQIAKVLHHLTCFKPVAAEITLLNRMRGLAIDKHLKWSVQERGSWVKWLKHFSGGRGTRRLRRSSRTPRKN